MRLFFALPLPETLKQALAALQAERLGQGLMAAWPRPEGMHLTLAFLGERPEAAWPPLQALGARVAARHAPFPLRTACLGGFPSPSAARVLWLGLEAEPRLEALAADLTAALEGAGFPREVRPFRPHVTIARPRRPGPVDLRGAPPPLAFPAEALGLFASLPDGPGPAVYRTLGLWRLTAPPGAP